MLHDLVARLLALVVALTRTLAHLQRQLADGDASDGYHTHADLYRHRMALNAHAAQYWLLQGYRVVKARRHHTGEPCLGGEWFILVAQLPTGQVSYHYHLDYWGLFDVPEADLPDAWDGHSPDDAYDRLCAALTSTERPRP